MSQKVFVTGATGVLGRRVVPALVGAGHAVTAVVRSEAKASAARAAGATPVHVDLFDRDAIRAAIASHDCVAHLATHIPSGPSAVRKAAWRINDTLRRDAAAAIAGAVVDAGIGRLIQESITFPYVAGGDQWIDESWERVYYWGNQSTVDAEAAAASVTAAGGTGIVLRFAMFMAPDSAHMQSIFGAARRGLVALLGAPDSYISFIHIDDAAAAVIVALEAPAGTYNVAEPDPVRRSTHCDMLGEVVGRSRLRPIPTLVERAGGDATASIARSHRITSQHLQDVGTWSPTIHCVDRWKELQ
ncbi:MAG: NAD(P)H-binding protein [Ilumatobacteraceae bacterium]|nr:NAD(P)H-binding protein [Ilumatobacteraceae bacterium]